MRSTYLLGAIGALVLGGAASASTLEEVTTKGIVATVNGFEIDMTFTPDGQFSAFNGMAKGAWRIDGERLCTKGENDAEEKCQLYPTGKKSGDTFEVQTENGPLTVRIK